MPNRFALPAGLLLLALGAVVHGATTHRWSLTAPAAERTRPLHDHVVQWGDYQAEEVPNDMPLKEKSVATNRKYVSASRNQTVIVSVITGPPGSVATHTPDVCYPASGFKTVKPPVRQTCEVPGFGTASYYVAEFEKKTATHVERQRVRWAWSVNGVWDAPDVPRLSYLRVADLAKVYIVTSETESSGVEDAPAVRQFLLAALGQYSALFAGR